MTEADRRVIDQQMGFSVTEFAHVLPAAMRDWVVTGESPAWQVSDPGGAPVASIRIQPLPDRAIGALRIPVLAVRLDLRAASAANVTEFQRRFERGFQRGGG